MNPRPSLLSARAEGLLAAVLAPQLAIGLLAWHERLDGYVPYREIWWANRALIIPVTAVFVLAVWTLFGLTGQHQARQARHEAAAEVTS